ncbi:helix-turn-helix transcriptional regulator [Novosphingobium humi]|uniref:helix-turn-helix transcriptional regulator n=1 Tax=Novosphingobium humi TaxID=2282397 RepID=UPI0025B26648|nr:AlpA family phage regulatory protein [Novosphingobium humi]WJS98235.1 AlpA family phage regulatory protein [Novosphingobium humi]
MNTDSSNLLRIADVMQKTALSRSYIYAKIKRGEFPAPISLGYKCSRWVSGDVDAWLQQQRG